MRRAPGFTYGLVTAAGFIAAGAERVLLIGSETLTRITNWSDRTNAFLFGDGAGAVVVEAVPGEPALLGWDIGVDGSLQPLFYSDYGGPGMAMRGQEVFRKAVRVTVDSATKSLERAKLTPSDVALFVPHQANMRIMDAVAERLGLPPERVASVIERTGNTSSASIPIALTDAANNGRLQDGDIVLFAGFGAGMTWASAVWRWGADPAALTNGQGLADLAIRVCRTRSRGDGGRYGRSSGDGRVVRRFQAVRCRSFAGRAVKDCPRGSVRRRPRC